MNQSVRLGRVAGIPVGANWSALAIVILLTLVLGGSVLPAAAKGSTPGTYWVVAIVASLLLLVSLLVHEGAHALTAQHMGVRVRSITLWLLGGVTQFEGEPATPRADFLTAVVGPLASLLLAGVFAGAAVGLQAAGAPLVMPVAAAWLAVMNGLLAVFNMLPGAPLDGGRVLRALLWKHYGDRDRAAVAACRAGQGLGGLLIAGGFAELLFLRSSGGLWIAFVGWFLVTASSTERQATTLAAALRGLTIRQIMTADPMLAPAWTTVDSYLAQLPPAPRQIIYPLVDFDGRPAGLVTLPQLARVPPGARSTTRLDQIGVPAAQVRVVAPDDPAKTVLERPLTPVAPAALVVEAGRVIGMVTPEDLERTVRVHGLRDRWASPDRLPQEPTLPEQDQPRPSSA